MRLPAPLKKLLELVGLRRTSIEFGPYISGIAAQRQLRKLSRRYPGVEFTVERRSGAVKFRTYLGRGLYKVEGSGDGYFLKGTA